MRVYDRNRLAEINIINLETRVDDATEIMIDAGCEWNATMQAYKVRDTDYMVDYMNEFVADNGGDDVWCASCSELLAADMNEIEECAAHVRHFIVAGPWEEDHLKSLAEETHTENEFKALSADEYREMLNTKFGFDL